MRTAFTVALTAAAVSIASLAPVSAQYGGYGGYGGGYGGYDSVRPSPAPRAAPAESRRPSPPAAVVGAPPRRQEARQPPAASPRAARPSPQRRPAAVANVPPAGEQRLVSDEVVIEVATGMSTEAADTLAQRHRLQRVVSQDMELTGSKLFRWRIPDRRSVSEVIRELQTDPNVRSAQPNYRFELQQAATAASSAADEPTQYTLEKMRIDEAHRIARGDKVLVAIIDSGVDFEHPELKGAIADRLDAIETDEPHAHGTGIAGAIVSRGKLTGTAPGARLLAVRAFGGMSGSAEGTTFAIMKGLDWAASRGARVINMSFAGPSDPILQRALASARRKGIVLVAASGNAGPRSAPLFPASDPNVIAVTATDADDKLFAQANRGKHISIAAPGVDILVPAPGAGYQISTGTSIACAHVSGVAALLIERFPKLDPEAVRKILAATAKDLGPKGRDDEFGFGLADAFQAATEAALELASANTRSVPVPRAR